MNHRGSINIILIVIGVVLISAASYFIFVKKSGPVIQEQSSIEIPTPTPNQVPNNGNQKPSIPSTTNLPKSPVTMPLVTITTDKQIYSLREAITVTINNGLDSDITTYDQRYDCSIVNIEKQSVAGWTEVRRCSSGAPSRNVTLKPKTTTKEQLKHHFGSLESGTYRASLILSKGTSFNFGNSFIVSSTPFIVQ